MPSLQCATLTLLAGHPDGNWSVDLPVEEVPPELPEPALGINFARDGERRCWCALCTCQAVTRWRQQGRRLPLRPALGISFARDGGCSTPCS